MKGFLRQYTPELYISLHFEFLLTSQIEEILDILFSIYHRCIIFDTDTPTPVCKNDIITHKYTSLIFTSKTLVDMPLHHVRKDAHLICSMIDTTLDPNIAKAFYMYINQTIDPNFINKLN